jgi:hypothetical protein
MQLPFSVVDLHLINRGHSTAAAQAAVLCPHCFTADVIAVRFSTMRFEGIIMQPNSSPLEHLTAFAIVFAAGILSTASFIAYMERVRRNAVRDHCKRLNSESNLATTSSARVRVVE